MKKRVLKLAACVFALAIFAASAMKTGNLELPGVLTANAASYSVAGNTSALYPYSKIKSRIGKYKDVNTEVVGWLTVPGTDINYPITHNANDNDYYLKRTWQGVNYPDIEYANYKKRPATAVYADYRTKFGEAWKNGTSRNIVLYGHNWSNLRPPFDIGSNPQHTMFAQLQSYTDKKFLTENPYIYFSTGELEGIWKVFAVGYTEVSPNFPYNTPNLSKDDFTGIIEDWKQRSLFDTGTEVTSSDRILTLSTCTRLYDAGGKQRFVVVARLLRATESENDKVVVKENPKVKQPDFNAKPNTQVATVETTQSQADSATTTQTQTQ